jgi:hypothetical protein
MSPSQCLNITSSSYRPTTSTTTCFAATTTTTTTCFATTNDDDEDDEDNNNDEYEEESGAYDDSVEHNEDCYYTVEGYEYDDESQPEIEQEFELANGISYTEWVARYTVDDEKPVSSYSTSNQILQRERERQFTLLRTNVVEKREALEKIEVAGFEASHALLNWNSDVEIMAPVLTSTERKAARAMRKEKHAVYPSINASVRALEQTLKTPVFTTSKSKFSKTTSASEFVFGAMGHREFARLERKAGIRRGTVRENAFDVMADKTLIDEALTKTKMCKFALTGATCRHGDKCRFAHDKSELAVRNCFYGRKCNRVYVTGDVFTNRNNTAVCGARHPLETDENFDARVLAPSPSPSSHTPPPPPSFVRPDTTNISKRGWKEVPVVKTTPMRKRASRWDQPAVGQQPLVQAPPVTPATKRKIRWDV